MKTLSSLSKLQDYLINNNIDLFLINRTDEFLNEYIAPYAERLHWVTDFSGSAGRAIITQNKAVLFVDGRYTFQAKQQINHDEIKIDHYHNFFKVFKESCRSGKTIAIDPKLHSINEVNKFKETVEENNSKLIFLNINPIDNIWSNQPEIRYSTIFDHPIEFSGLDRKIKINKFKESLKDNNLDYYLLTSLDSIAWLLNIRGDDIRYTPISFLYLFIPLEGKPIFYASLENISSELKQDLNQILILEPINKIDALFNEVVKNKNIGMDFLQTSYFFYNIALVKDLIVKDLQNPCLIPKATKNHVEQEGARNAHIRDGVSVTKFLFYLKNNKDLTKETEKSLAEKLFKYRKNNKLFHSLSFDTISAVGKNAALPHYRVSKVSDSKIRSNSIYLVDSGGQYYDGTTDITRTVVLGKPNQEQIDRFTRVLKGHIKLATHIFPKGTKGTDIDYLARESLNEINCDYDHGTGHGIGSFLSVHEAPQRIAKKNQFQSVELIPGMIISNEPGFYREGEYGIRTENILIIKEKDKKNLSFENISWAPIDRDLIDIKMLTPSEINWINNYHLKVLQNLLNFLDPHEKDWLKNVTAPL